MIVRVVVLAAAASVASASTGFAQPKEPIGRFVADVRAASASLPTVAGWTPFVPEGTTIPSRTLGLDTGAHVYIARFQRAAIGVGATWLVARGTAAPEPVVNDPANPTTPGSTVPPGVIPDVTTRMSSFAPQLSLNFGHSLGWSYLSAGLGRTRVQGEAMAATVMYAPTDSGWVTTIDIGGGARWFINPHLGVSLDIRWRMLGDTETAGNTTLFGIAGGIALK